MKRYAAFFGTALIGAAVGAFVTSSFYVRAIRAAFPSAIHALEDKQEYSCVISLAALNSLETGKPDRAKLLLAREVASYYRYPFTQADSPRRKKLLTQIDTVRSKSAVLDQALKNKPQ